MAIHRFTQQAFTVLAALALRNRFVVIVGCLLVGFHPSAIATQCTVVSDCYGTYGPGADSCVSGFCQCGSNQCDALSGGGNRTDYDDDGVARRRDACPYTRAGYNRYNSAPFNVASSGASRGCADYDQDGIYANDDDCPNTTSGVSVDSQGCEIIPSDSDGDGFADSADACPSVAGVAPNGCPAAADTDGDGVVDGSDLCPGTSLGDTVNGDGCVDFDGDGFAENVDQCPNTPSGAIVLAAGCPDSDGDGIHDGRDRCPGTASGKTVDTDGCPANGRLDISSQPLELGATVEPNVMVIMDDSGSMDGELMIANTVESVWYPVANNYYEIDYLFNYGNLFAINHSWGHIAPSQETLAAHSSFGNNDPSLANIYGVWRLRSAAYNTIYYNPATRYQPWVGYSNSAPGAALTHPDGTRTVNLTQNLPSYITYGLIAPSGAALDITTSNFYAPRYYTWDDSNNDGIVDENEGTLVEIRNGVSHVGSSDRTDCIDYTQCNYSEEIQNFANWFTFYRRRDFAAKGALSRVVEDQTGIRLGYSSINGSAINMRVASLNNSPFSGNKQKFLSSVYSADSNGGTPLRSALHKTGRYFECLSGDTFNTTSNSNPGDSNCPLFSDADGGACQQNYAILVSDGSWSGSSPGIGDIDSDNSSVYDGNNFADKPSAIQNTLADVAMYYYERDLHSTLSNKVRTTAIDRRRARIGQMDDKEMFQHMATYTVGFGVYGAFESMPASISESWTWGDPSNNATIKVDDMRHAAYNGRGEFYSAANPSDLIEQLSGVFLSIKAGAGAASAVSFNTQEIQNDTQVFRAFFDTQTNTGDLIAQKVEIDGSVSNAVDKNGELDFSQITWSAAEKLDNDGNRVIVTYNPTQNTGVPFQYSNLSDAQKDVLSDEELRFLRGDRSTETANGGSLRTRASNKGLLGDIVHSSPLFVGAPPFSASRRSTSPYPTGANDLYTHYKSNHENRQSTVFVAANDGMLHGFRADDDPGESNAGTERFAYVPNKIISHVLNPTEMLDVFTNTNYEHQYFVDLSPASNDVFAKTTANGSKAWSTILIGGLGAGGKGYFALDITNPLNFANETAAATEVMWEFTDEDDNNLGYTFSPALIGMSNLVDKSEQLWVGLMGNGYNSQTGIASLFVLNLEGGLDGDWTDNGDYLVLSTGVGADSAGIPNGLGIPRGVDMDSNGTVDRVYAGDLQGNVFRFDISSSNQNQWASNVTKIFTAKDSAGRAQPILTRPAVVAHPDDPSKLIVVVTTGSWMTTSDDTDTSIQSLYGIVDDNSASPTTVNRSHLVQQSYTNVNDANYGQVRTLSNNTVDYTSKRGWYIDLDLYAGERAIRNLQIRGDKAFVNTVFPNSNSQCSVPSGGAELSFNPQTGGNNNSRTFDFNDDGTFDTIDDTGNGDIISGRVFDVVPSDSTFIGSRRYTQKSDKTITSINTNTGSTARTGRLSWRELVEN